MIAYGKPHKKRLHSDLPRVNGATRCKRYLMVPLENGLHVPLAKLKDLRKAAPKNAVWRLVKDGVVCGWSSPTRKGFVRIQGYEFSAPALWYPSEVQ